MASQYSIRRFHELSSHSVFFSTDLYYILWSKTIKYYAFVTYTKKLCRGIGWGWVTVIWSGRGIPRQSFCEWVISVFICPLHLTFESWLAFEEAALCSSYNCTSCSSFMYSNISGSRYLPTVFFLAWCKGFVCFAKFIA